MFDDFLCKLWSSQVRPTLMLYRKKNNIELNIHSDQSKHVKYCTWHRERCFLFKENITKGRGRGTGVSADIYSDTITQLTLQRSLNLFPQSVKVRVSIKALSKYERPKMKGDARQKCSLFLRKRLHHELRTHNVYPILCSPYSYSNPK